nr:DUF2721 domain-containing protein [uncultured Rhodopila sp.]
MGGFSASQAIIAAMITPALLILASGSLIATALLRLARVVDRVRKLAEPAAPIELAEELGRHRRRAELAERAVRLYFAAVLCFVLAGFGIAIDHFAADRLTWLPVALTTIGMGLIVAGSVAMLAECRCATAQIESEMRALGAADRR